MASAWIEYPIELIGRWKDGAEGDYPARFIYQPETEDSNE